MSSENVNTYNDQTKSFQQMVKDCIGGLSAADTKTEEVTHLCDPRFAAGQIFTATVLGSLLGRAFHTPGTLEVIQALVNPDDACDDSIFPWQVYPQPQYIGMSYGEVFSSLIHD